MDFRKNSLPIVTNILDYLRLLLKFEIGEVTNSIVRNLKPIFHCDAKPIALGPGIGLDPTILLWGFQHVGI